MSSRFPFSRPVGDIEHISTKSPHSNCSNHSTPNKLSTPHSTSVSPHTNISTNSINTHYHKLSSQLKIQIPEVPSIASRDSVKLNPQQNPHKKQHHLTVPSDSENLSSPLLSEPEPSEPSPVPLTLNRCSVSNPKSESTSSPPPDTTPYYQQRYTSYPGNYSPLSTTSSFYDRDNLTPLYTAHLLSLTQDNHLPDLSLAPLNILSPNSPTPIDYHIHSLQIINKSNRSTPTPTGYLLEINKNYYNCATDSDYNFDSDRDLDQIETDLDLEQHLITMGCCCSGNIDDKLKENDVNTEPITQQSSKLQITLNQATPIRRKRTFTDRFFRSNAAVFQRNKKLDEKESKFKRKNDTTSPRNGSTQHSVDDDYPQPIPNDAEFNKHEHTLTNRKSKSKNLSLLGPFQEKMEVTETRTYNTFEEQQDLVSPIPQLDKIGSLTNAKRPSSSALSSPLHSVRLSITPKGHLAPIHIMDHSDEDLEDHSLSTTDSKEENEHTKYSEINTPVHFLKKNRTITKFVSSQQSQTSDRNVLLRRKRRQGVSERHTLTFSKPPLPPHELPQSPKFAEIDLDVTKPREFLHKILRDNLLFKGVDPEFRIKMVTKVVELMRAADFDNSEILIHQNAEGDAFYAIVDGSFDILVHSADENNELQSRKVAVASAGDCVGEYALLYNQPRTATLVATEKSRVWGITAEQFAQMRQEIMDWNVDRFEQRQQFLHSIPLFQKLEQHELLNMTHACHAEIYDINKYIIKPEPGIDGSENTNVYIIMEGTVVVSYDKAPLESLSDDDEDDDDLHSQMDDDDDVGVELITDNDNDNDSDNKARAQLQPDIKLGLTLNTYSSIDSYHDVNIGGTLQYQHPVANETGTTIGAITDPPIMEDIDNNVFRVNLAAMRSTDDNNAITPAVKAQRSKPLTLSALNSVNSVQSVHSINIVGIDMGACRGDKELGKSDYFARNLFYENSYDGDEEIVCARAHTRCKVLKIARDDFVLIMASQNNGSGHYLFNDSGVVVDGELEDVTSWKHQIARLQLADLEERDVLGIGSFGRVTLVEDTSLAGNGATYALKSVSKYRVVRTGQESHIINEKRVLTMLDSPFCVKLYATFKTEETIYFVTEVVLGGELFTVLRYNEKFDKNATRFYAGCVVMALEHLHSMDIIYRDLKPENLLLNSAGYLQLTDFGFAKKRNTTCTLCGTPQYLAPEVIHNWVQSFATDWWALGVLLYEMVVGHPPFEDDENIKMYEKILVHEPEFPQDINSKLRHLIQKLLEKNAYQRLGSGAGGSRQVKNHPFFRNKLSWNDLYDMKLEPPYKPKIADKLDTSNFDHFSDYESGGSSLDYPDRDDDDEQQHQFDPNSPHYQWVDQF